MFLINVCLLGALTWTQIVPFLTTNAPERAGGKGRNFMKRIKIPPGYHCSTMPASLSRSAFGSLLRGAQFLISFSL